MAFFRDVNFRSAGGDVIAFFRSQDGFNPLVLLAACAPPALIVAAFYFDLQSKSTPGPPEVIYFESWPATRSIEESMASNAERQKRKDAARLREKEAYKAFGRAVGMDVDRIDREAHAEREAAAKAAKAGATK